MKKTIRNILLGCIATAAAAMTVFPGASKSQADVVSQPFSVMARSGFPVYIPIDLVTVDSVAGINGKATYDPAKLTNPEIFVGSPSGGFISAGNVVTPGDFRFVIYDNPTAIMDLFGTQDIYIKFDIVGGLPANQQDVVTFSMEAASDPQGTSIGQSALVDFGDITVVINDNTAANDWAQYR